MKPATPSGFPTWNTQTLLTVNGVRVGSSFYCGGWDMMGNIAGHSTEFRLVQMEAPVELRPPGRGSCAN